MDMAQLTPTELRIAQLVTEGRLDKEIASAIGVSCDACRQRLHTLTQKIGVSNRAALAAWYVRRTEVRS